MTPTNIADLFGWGNTDFAFGYFFQGYPYLAQLLQIAEVPRAVRNAGRGDDHCTMGQAQGDRQEKKRTATAPRNWPKMRVSRVENSD